MSINDGKNAVCTEIPRRTETVMYAHDLDALADCFTEDFLIEDDTSSWPNY
jgi:hypothetical protein